MSAPPRAEQLRAELLRLIDDDERTRAELAADGSLFDGYHPRMAAVHRRNADRLRAIIAEHGWPGVALVGEDGGEAAWRIAQHAIGAPDFMRRCLTLVAHAVAAGDAPGWQVAYLDDRIRGFEGRPQRHGTQLDFDAEGRAVPLPIEDPDGVDARRAALGLEPLAERLARAGRASGREPSDPAQRAARERDYERWLRDVGWRIDSPSS